MGEDNTPIMRRVIITSFRDTLNHLGDVYSVARWQPPRHHFITLQDLAARDELGSPLTHIEPAEFMPRYFARLDRYGRDVITRIAEPADTPLTTTLLCWCNPLRQRQWPHLYCHTILIGWWIEKYHPHVDIVYMDGREHDWFGDVHFSEAQIP